MCDELNNHDIEGGADYTSFHEAVCNNPTRANMFDRHLSKPEQAELE